MKRRILFLLLLVFCQIANSQVLDTTQLAIHYGFKFMPDSSKREYFESKPFVLMIGKTNALFQHLYIYETDSASFNPTGGKGFGRGLLGAFFQPEVYTNHLSGKQSVVERLLGWNYKTTFSVANFEWKPQQSSRIINGYTCFNAIGKWRGRTWEAWYCPELPYNYGPWKLSGLPGLILEAYDSDREYVFTAIKITKKFTYYHKIKLPDSFQELTEKEFNKVLKVFHTDRQGFLKARNTRGSDGSQISGMTLTRDPNYVPNPNQKVWLNNNNPEKIKD